MSSQMSKLTSKVIEKGADPMGQQDNNIEGIYGTNGFYFQVWGRHCRLFFG
jgi:hypothetical protein